MPVTIDFGSILELLRDGGLLAFCLLVFWALWKKILVFGYQLEDARTEWARERQDLVDRAKLWQDTALDLLGAARDAGAITKAAVEQLRGQAV